MRGFLGQEQKLTSGNSDGGFQVLGSEFGQVTFHEVSTVSGGSLEASTGLEAKVSQTPRRCSFL